MAFEPLRVPWLEERVLSCEPDLLVVDKPIGLPVHGGNETHAHDVVTRLSTYLSERGEDPYLGVHQRLDQDSSGVLFFTRKKELNPRVAVDFEQHRVKRAYVAAVFDGGLAAEGELQHRLEHVRDRTRVVERGGKLARSRYRVLERRNARALIELSPETGRTHQLRAQLAAVKSPIAGDTWYGGTPAPRLMLHAVRLGIPSLNRSFETNVPQLFVDWVHGATLGLGSEADLRARLRDSGVHRYPLFRRASAFRLAHDFADGLPGVTIDRYGDFAVLAVSTPEAIERQDEIARLLLELGAKGVYLKIRERADQRSVDPKIVAPSEPIAGEAAPSEIDVDEDGLVYGVRLGDGLSTGLFVDQRENRALVRELSRGKRVLNLFSYTGSFSVAAAAGGASRVVSVDLSAPALERGKLNFEKNQLGHVEHECVHSDAIEWLRRAKKRGDRFDLVVVDPPSFGTRGRRSTFDVATGYADLAADALALIVPDGRLLAVTNHKRTSQERLRKLLHEAGRRSGRAFVQLKDLASPLDCPDAPEGPLAMKSALVRVR